MDCNLPGSSVQEISQASWNGLPIPSPGDLPDPGIEPTSSTLLVDSLPLSHLRSPCVITSVAQMVQPKTKWQNNSKYLVKGESAHYAILITSVDVKTYQREKLRGGI